jgi:transposase, IS5 family
MDVRPNHVTPRLCIMIRDRYDPINVFELVPQLTLTMDPVLAQLDTLLGDDVLFRQVKAAMSHRFPHSADRGCPSTPVEVVLRMLVVRRLYDWGYDATEHFVADSLVLRRFCRVYWQSVPDSSTLNRWAGVIGEQTLEVLHQRVVQLGRQHRVSRGRKLRFDGTVVETAIHYPTDSSLLSDGVRVLSRLLQRAKDGAAVASRTLFRDRTRSAKRLARAIGETARRRGEQAAAEREAAYERLVHLTRAMLRQAERVQALLPEGATVRQELAHYATLTQRVVEQTVRRLAGEQVPATEKVVSLFEEHTAILRRNKPRQETEFGHRVLLGEAEGGILSSYQVLPGTEAEAAYLEEGVRRQQQLFGKPPRLVAADRAFSAKAEAVRDLGVERVVIPRQGKRKPKEEAEGWFRRGRRFRAGIEGRISVLKRRGFLGRCRDHGLEGFDRWVGWGILVANLTTIARHQAGRPKARAA